MGNGVPLTDGGLRYMRSTADLHDVEDIRGRFYVDSREAVLEPGYVIVRTVNNLTLRGGLESIM